MNLRLLLSSLRLLPLLIWSPFLFAQHEMHNMGGASHMELQTMPADNAVLGSAPDQLMLHFGPEVRLVKLTLRNTDNDLVDIGFRYDPEPAKDFIHRLPHLAADDYYRVEWGIIEDDGTLVRGSFHFSFGPDARPPSYWLDQTEQMQHIMSPDYRLLQPGAQ